MNTQPANQPSSYTSLRRQIANTIAPSPVVIFISPVPVSGSRFTPALPVPRCEGQWLPADDLPYELTGSRDTLTALIECAISQTFRERGFRVVMDSTRRNPRALCCDLPALRGLWKVCAAERAGLMMDVLAPNAPDGLCGRFIRLTKAQWLVEAALGASQDKEGNPI